MSRERKGNVRELENVIEQALNIVETDILVPDHLPAKIYKLKTQPRKKDDDTEKLKNAEAKLIKDTLDICQWNISKAASTLGIGRNTLYRKIRRYNLYEETEGC